MLQHICNYEEWAIIKACSIPKRNIQYREWRNWFNRKYNNSHFLQRFPYNCKIRAILLETRENSSLKAFCFWISSFFFTKKIRSQNFLLRLSIIRFSKRRLKRALPESEWSEYTLKDSATIYSRSNKDFWEISVF